MGPGYQALRESAAWLDLSVRGRIVATGKDRVRLLHSISTNSIRDLKPGQGFRYSSGAILETPVGVMQGRYRMVADGGDVFDAPIAPFTLAMPGMLH